MRPNVIPLLGAGTLASVFSGEALQKVVERDPVPELGLFQVEKCGHAMRQRRAVRMIFPMVDNGMREFAMILFAALSHRAGRIVVTGVVVGLAEYKNPTATNALRVTTPSPWLEHHIAAQGFHGGTLPHRSLAPVCRFLSFPTQN